MKRITITLHEIEHGGDQRNAEEAIQKAGGIIVSAEPDFDAEFCEFIVDVPESELNGFRKRVDKIYWGDED
jgi:hypothetical protein